MKIFLSYRRDESRHIAGRIYDRLTAHFGPDTVFKDVDSIPPGADFRARLQQAVEQAAAMLVVIGDRWLTLTDQLGRRRLDDENDFVRIEIETALQRRIAIVPVLTDGAAMPARNALPASLAELPFRHAAVVRPDPDFHQDMNRVVYALEAHGIQPLRPSKSDLEIVSVRRTSDFELDVTLRNVGNDPAVIHRIDLTLVQDRGIYLPIINPSAKYDMPIGDLDEGQTRSLDVSHYVEPHGVDRFKIALYSTRSLLLRLTLHYNRDQKVEASAET